jgi:CheY-like chemotaxis protein
MTLVLVVDDEACIRRSVRKMLEHAGHEVLESANGVDALCLLERITPDILITDLHMPDCDGAELARALRESGRPQPGLIFLSGDDKQTVLAHASAVGAAGLTKPFSLAELLGAIEEVSTTPD